MTKSRKKAMEAFLAHLLICFAVAGYLCLIYMPTASGSPSIRKIVTSMSCGLMVKDFSRLLDGPYKEPHSNVLKGVMKMASTVDMADMLMDRGVFPFAKYVRKLDRLPPGQAATRNKPSAMLGL